MVGLAINGIMCDEVGYLILTAAAIFIPLFATSDAMLLAGQVVSGIP
jgi:SP family general alpha glucoside:H+ symporter-like MFS transporter